MLILLLTQFGQTFQLVASASTEENDFELIIESASREQSIIKVTALNESVDSIELTLPDQATFSEKLTNGFENGNSKVVYDEQNHVVTLSRLDNSKELSVTIALVDLLQEENTISARAIIDGKTTEDKVYTIKIPSSQSENNSALQAAPVEITPFSGNLNVDLDVSPHSETITSGKAAGYKLALKVTGSMTEYIDARIVVDLPITEYTSFTQDMSELVIDDITPTYDSVDHTLTYEFDSLKSGRSYETFINVNTENGLSPDGAELTARATFEAAEQEMITDNATVIIDSSGAINSSKQFLKVRENTSNLAYPNSTTLWEIKIDIPKKDVGQMYLKEGTKISMTDSLPAGLTYDSMEVGPDPTQSGNDLTWTFNVPSIEEQKHADDEIFSITIQVWLKVNSGTVNQQLKNNINAEVTFINNVKSTTTANHTITIVDSATANGDIKGTWYVPNHFGPKGDSNGVGNNDNRNPNPVVYDDAILQFAHGIAPLTESQYGNFEKYTTSYTIDPNLIFKELKTPGGFIYRPNANYPAGVPFQQDQEPTFDIRAMVNGSERLLIKNADINHVYTRSDLGIKETDDVSIIYYDFTHAPAGMLNQGVPQYYFEIVPGYVGQVKNTFDVFGVNGKGETFKNKYNSDPLAGPRTAQIAARPKKTPPSSTVQIELLDHAGGEVVTGENRMKVTLSNESTSTVPMQSQLETVALLPFGVFLKENPNPTYLDEDGRTDSGGGYEVLSDDYNGSGRQLVKITWSEPRLRIGKNLTAELDIMISNGAPNLLSFDVYGFSGDEVLEVPTTSGASITDTILQVDEEDLNSNGSTDQPRLKSGNEYFIRGEYNIQTEKLVKGELDEDYSLFGHTIPNGSIDYQLKLTNKTGTDISKMTLIDVLPSTGDLGITDNIERASQFTPTLTREIILPDAWQDKVDVYYSTAKNPERDDLTRNTIYPESTAQMTNPASAEEPNWMTASEVTDWSTVHSFKIELVESGTWIAGEDMTIEFSMQAPSESEVDRSVLDASIEPTSRAAWNSFAIATDHGQPVEPSRVGIYMDYAIEDPVVEKTVNNQKETVELVNRDERFTWEIDYNFGNYTNNWDSVLLSDPIHELLDIGNVQVIDQNGEDVSENGVIDITDNLVTFTLDKKNDSFAYLKDQTYTLVIESFIKEDVTDEELEPFIQSGGIPNQAELIIDNEPIESNVVKVKPPVRGEIHLIKKDKDTGATLEGAEFELRKYENDFSDLDDFEVIETGTTTENGRLVFKDLKVGNYRLVETKSPDGYRLLTKPLDIEVTEDNRLVELEVENEKSQYLLPDTGGSGSELYLIVGGAFILISALAGGYYVFRIKRGYQS